MNNKKSLLFIFFFILYFFSTIINYSGKNESLDIDIKQNTQDYSKRLEISTLSWTNATIVTTESVNGSYFPAVAVDSLGNVHVAYEDDTNLGGSGFDRDIIYKRWNASISRWMPPEVVSSESDEGSGGITIAVDGSGNVHIAWDDYSDYAGAGSDVDIFYKLRNATTGIWTTTEIVSVEGSSTSSDPSIAVDNSGNAHISWFDWANYDSSGTDPDIFYRCYNATTESWTTTEVVSTESNDYSLTSSIAVDTSGNVHVAWENYGSDCGSGSDNDIFYKSRNSTAWKTTEVVSTVSSASSGRPSIALDYSDNVHIMWHDAENYDSSGTDYDIFYRLWNATSELWSTTEVISTESSGSSQFPKIGMDGSGNLHAIWRDWTPDYGGSGSDDDIFYKMLNATTDTWTTTEVVSKESTTMSVLPEIAVESSGYAHVVWQDATNYNESGTDSDIFYKRTRFDSIPYTNTLSTVVTSALGTETIDWILYDDFGGSYYRVWANDTNGDFYLWKDWNKWTNNGTNLYININRTAPGIFNYTIEYNDTINQFGIPNTIIVIINDEIPYLTQPSTVITSAVGTETINWTLCDDYSDEGQYRVWANDTKGDFYLWVDWSPWYNETTLNIPINRTTPGIFNYTIQYNDTQNQFGAQSTVIVIITNNKPVCSNSPSDVSTWENEIVNITWVLTDDFKIDSYCVLINGTPGSWKPWDNFYAVNITIDTSVPGFFNYTILFNDSSGEMAFDDVIVKIGEVPDSPGDGDDDSTNAPEQNIQIIILLVIGIILGFSIGGTVLVKKSKRTLKEKEAEVDKLKNLRNEITEDDIVISKERRFCLVHKGPIEGYSFICPSCGAFYCTKCLDAVKEIENVCWSCGAPLDPSKPVKITEEKEKIDAFMEEESRREKYKPKKGLKK